MEDLEWKELNLEGVLCLLLLEDLRIEEEEDLPFQEEYIGSGARASGPVLSGL
tara:strand:- start:83 stop:241 length:159 start_codon:yes stop_codon:yes gene_type:complete